MRLRSIFFLCFFLLACDEKVPGGAISIRNDIQDKEFNSFRIDQVRTKAGAVLFSQTLHPGDEVSLPYKGIRSFTLTRQYSDHANVYVVSCPPEFSSKVTMKLIDIHLGKVPGGCSLSKTGKMKDGFTRWDDDD